MANALSKIVARAKQLQHKQKSLTWKAAIKKASAEYRGGKLGAVKKSFRQTGSSNKKMDKKLKAKPPGKRKSASGKTYYERRKNRSDKPGTLTGLGQVLHYFKGENINSLDDLKRIYFKKAKLYHPDSGGNTADFQKMSAEYETLLKKVLSGSELNTDEIKTEIELDEALRKAASAIVGLPGITIEVTYKWLWVSGNTYPIRNELKAAGFQFAPVKKMWYFKGIESSGRGKLTMDEIRSKYGSQILKDQMKKLSGAEHGLSATKRRSFLLNIKKATRLLSKRSNKQVSVAGILRKTF